MTVDRASGFTLTEVLVAFAIMAAALMVLLPLVSDNAVLGAGAQRMKAATLLAESKLAEVGTVLLLASSDIRGTQGEFLWRVSIGSPTRVATAGAERLGAFDIVTTVSRGDPEVPPLITLRTLRLGNLPP